MWRGATSLRGGGQWGTPGRETKAGSSTDDATTRVRLFNAPPTSKPVGELELQKKRSRSHRLSEEALLAEQSEAKIVRRLQIPQATFGFDFTNGIDSEFRACEVEDEARGRTTAKRRSSAPEPKGWSQASKAQPSIALERRSKSASPARWHAKGSISSLSIHPSGLQSAYHDGSIYSAARPSCTASAHLRRLRANSASFPTTLSPPSPPTSPASNKPCLPKSQISRSSYFPFLFAPRPPSPPSSSYSWSSVRKLKVRFKPSAQSDITVNAWLLGVQALKRGEKRSWDPRLGEAAIEWANLEVEVETGSPSRISVVYQDYKRRCFSPGDLGIEQIMQAVTSPHRPS